jgi:hypothetical protein
MFQRSVQVGVTIFAFATVLGACGAKQPASSEASLPAALTGDFSDNPMVAFVPVDTPYAFASFKPVPLDFLRMLAARFGPLVRRAAEADIAKGKDPDDARELLDWSDTIDLKHFEDLGFSRTARLVIYGIGPYPVFRFEISNGDRVFELIQHKAKHKDVPATARAGRHYWIENTSSGTGLLAVAPKELVVAFAPRRVIDSNLAALLGEQRPAKSLTTAAFRELARRDGFTGQGVGFVDLTRVTALAAEAARSSPACRTAIAEVAARAPRLVLGFDDFTANRLAFGMALELAPDLLADVRRLSTPLVGYDRLSGHKPAMALALALDIEQGRALLSRIAAGLLGLGERCLEPRLIARANTLAEVASRPLPPVFAGVRGGFVVVNELKLGPNGPTSIDGYGVLQGDHIDEIAKLAMSNVPGLSLHSDGKATALPAMIQFPGHIAASAHAIGLALGGDSATTAAEVVAAKPAPAPLTLLQFDYSRLADLIAAFGHDKDPIGPETLAALGLLTIKMTIAERGPSWWLSFEFR